MICVFSGLWLRLKHFYRFDCIACSDERNNEKVIIVTGNDITMSGRGKSSKAQSVMTGKTDSVLGVQHGSPEVANPVGFDPAFNPAHDLAEEERAAIMNGGAAPAPAAAQPSGERRPRDPHDEASEPEQPKQKHKSEVILTTEMVWAKVLETEAKHDNMLMDLNKKVDQLFRVYEDAKTKIPVDTQNLVRDNMFVQMDLLRKELMASMTNDVKNPIDTKAIEVDTKLDKLEWRTRT